MIGVLLINMSHLHVQNKINHGYPSELFKDLGFDEQHDEHDEQHVEDEEEINPSKRKRKRSNPDEVNGYFLTQFNLFLKMIKMICFIW